MPITIHGTIATSRPMITMRLMGDASWTRRGRGRVTALEREGQGAVGGRLGGATRAPIAPALLELIEAVCRRDRCERARRLVEGRRAEDRLHARVVAVRVVVAGRLGELR